MTRERGVLERVLRLAVLLVLIYAAIIAWFAWKEDAYVYFPRKGLHSGASVNIEVETVSLKTSDGIRLVCWIIPSLDSSNAWLMYFQGNGGNISSRGYVEHYKALSHLGVNVFALGYRGYGDSEGSPHEQGLYVDARTAFDYLVRERGVSPARIVLFGYSLGSAVATELAARVEVAGVILEGAFLSASKIGQELYPFLPVSLIIKNRYDSLGRIHRVDEPKLFLHATHDEIIPLEHGRTLFEAAREPKTFVETGGGHNTAQRADSALFYGSIAAFLHQLELLQ